MNNPDIYRPIYYPFRWKDTAEDLDVKIRFSIFMIIGASAGLPALVWSVGELIEHRKNGHRISVFIILLLLTDFTELYLSPYVLMKDLLDELSENINWTCWVFSILSWSPRVCGLLLNQLVALEGILSVKFPQYTGLSSRWYRFFYIFALFCMIICNIILCYLKMTGLYRFVLYVCCVSYVSVIMWIIFCVVSCSAEHHSQSSRKTDPHIVIVFIFSQLVLFFCVVTSFLHDIPYLSHIPWLLMSLRLISDPLLCVLVCRQNLRVQTSQNPEETSVQPE